VKSLLSAAKLALTFLLLWAFMPVIEDIMLVIARFFFRLGDILHLIPDPF
jgi:hypothetical protein